MTTKNFTKIVTKEHGKILYNELKKFIITNKLFGDEDKYLYPEENRLGIDIKFKQFKVPQFYKVKDYCFEMDLYFRTDIFISSKMGDEDLIDCYEEEFTISATVELHEGIKNFKVNNVQVGIIERDVPLNLRLSEFLVPYITNQEYEKYAREFLEKYFPEGLDEPRLLPPSLLVERMGLKVRYGVLPNECFGRIVFAKEKITLYDLVDCCERKVMVEPGTIVVNYELLFQNSSGLLHNTIVHECLHWYLHGKYFELLKLLNPEETSLSCCNEINSKSRRADVRNRCFMEIQANAISPLVLMPEESARRKFNELMELSKERNNLLTERLIIYNAVSMFASFFGASFECSVNRLLSLGFTEVSCFKNDDEGKTLPVYRTKYKLKKNETFFINRKQAASIISFNETINEKIKFNKIKYVQGTFVLNSPEFIERDSDGLEKLTKKALNDLSKCCLVIVIDRKIIGVEYDPESFGMSTVSSGGAKFKQECKASIADNNLNTDIYELAEDIEDPVIEYREINEFIKELDKLSTFGDKLKKVMERYGFSTRSLETTSFVSRTSIANYVNNKELLDYKVLMRLCGGMQLHPLLSEYLFEHSHVLNIFSRKEEPFNLYKLLMNNHPNAGIEYWQKIIMVEFPDNSSFYLY